MTSASFPPGSRWVKGKATLLAFTFLVALSLVVAACGTTAQNKGGTHTLTAICSVGGSYTQNMSPFSPNVNCGVDGLVYENLAYVNGVTGQETPMLSTGHQYSADNMTLTFNTRQGVKWSDDQAFTANDVAFTFNMLKQYPTADSSGCGNTSPASPRLTPIRSSCNSQTLRRRCCPSSRANLHRATAHLVIGWRPDQIYQHPARRHRSDETQEFDAQVIKYVKNPTFWQADKVKVDELDYPVVNSNDTALLKMASHQADWTGIFSAALQTAFVQKDSTHNHVYMVPVVPVQIIPNLKNPLLAQLPVRQAISAALDRSQMSTAGEAGLEQPASPTGLMPGQEKYLDASFNGKLPEFSAASPSQADSILEGAGSRKAPTASMPMLRATSWTSRLRFLATTQTMCRISRSHSRTSRRLASV